MSEQACAAEGVQGGAEVGPTPRSLVPGKKRVSLSWLLLFHFLLQHLESFQPLAEELFLLKPNPNHDRGCGDQRSTFPRARAVPQPSEEIQTGGQETAALQAHRICRLDKCNPGNVN